MPSRKKTSKAFKALKKDKFSKDSLGSKAKAVNLQHLLQLQQHQKNRRVKTALAPVSTAAAYNQQITELEQRKNGKKKQVQQTAVLKLAPASFKHVPDSKPDIMFADSLLADEGDSYHQEIPQYNSKKERQRYFHSQSNRFVGLDVDSEDEEPVKMSLQPASFSFALATEKPKTQDDDDI